MIKEASTGPFQVSIGRSKFRFTLKESIVALSTITAARTCVPASSTNKPAINLPLVCMIDTFRRRGTIVDASDIPAQAKKWRRATATNPATGDATIPVGRSSMPSVAISGSAWN
ncbi:MAG: hypothetical protein ABI411_19345 [Tahibacter sp.]